MNPDLHFDGRVGVDPEPESVEWIVLAACADRRGWPEIRRLVRGQFEDAIERLREMGWGFEWVTRQ